MQDPEVLQQMQAQQLAYQQQQQLGGFLNNPYGLGTLDFLNAVRPIQSTYTKPEPQPEIVDVGEDRIDVPYKDWLEWQKFKRAPWWRRMFWRLK